MALGVVSGITPARFVASPLPDDHSHNEGQAEMSPYIQTGEAGSSATSYLPMLELCIEANLELTNTSWSFRVAKVAMMDDEDVVRELEELEKLPYDLYLDDVDESVEWPRGRKPHTRRGGASTRGGGGPRTRGGRRGRGRQSINRSSEREADMFEVEGGECKWDMDGQESGGCGEDYAPAGGIERPPPSSSYATSRGGHRGPPALKPFARNDEHKDGGGGGAAANSEDYPPGYAHSPATRGGHRGPPCYKPFGGRGGEDEGGAGAGFAGRAAVYDRGWTAGDADDGPPPANPPPYTPHRKDPRLAGKEHGHKCFHPFKLSSFKWEANLSWVQILPKLAVVREHSSSRDMWRPSPPMGRDGSNRSGGDVHSVQQSYGMQSYEMSAPSMYQEGNYNSSVPAGPPPASYDANTNNYHSGYQQYGYDIGNYHSGYQQQQQQTYSGDYNAQQSGWQDNNMIYPDMSQPPPVSIPSATSSSSVNMRSSQASSQPCGGPPPVDIQKAEEAKKEAIQHELMQQKQTLAKQREEYVKKAVVIARELNLLKDQEAELLREDSRDSKATRILKENHKLQLEIQNKLKAINNVIDMLTGIIGDEKDVVFKAVQREESKAAKKRAKSPSSSPPRRSASESDSDSDSSPERDSRKSKAQDDRKDSKQSPAVPPPPPISHAGSSDRQVYNYVYYDPEMHWCRVCNVFPRTAKEFLNHLHSSEHKKETLERKLVDMPWHNKQSEEESPSYKNAPNRRTPIRGRLKKFWRPDFMKQGMEDFNNSSRLALLTKEENSCGAESYSSIVVKDKFETKCVTSGCIVIAGLQFFISVTAWYCKLCNAWIGDLHCASLHLKSKTHGDNYASFTEQNPHWETDWLADRERAYERRSEDQRRRGGAASVMQGESMTDQLPLALHGSSKAAAAVAEEKSSSHHHRHHKEHRKKDKKKSKGGGDEEVAVLGPAAAADKKAKKKRKKQRKKQRKGRKPRDSSDSSSSSTSTSSSTSSSSEDEEEEDEEGGGGGRFVKARDVSAGVTSATVAGGLPFDRTKSIRIAMRSKDKLSMLHHIAAVAAEGRSASSEAAIAAAQASKWESPPPAPPPPQADSKDHESRETAKEAHAKASSAARKASSANGGMTLVSSADDDKLLKEWAAPLRDVVSEGERQLLNNIKERVKQKQEAEKERDRGALAAQVAY
ncbi:Uncharacterized protein GBIM_20259 [Gryllus bimaculatus]|nr:Uncharacterized protein GBIM_20259 [Gryllus bimaculatus]